jgi:hypothetical protein
VLLLLGAAAAAAAGPGAAPDAAAVDGNCVGNCAVIMDRLEECCLTSIVVKVYTYSLDVYSVNRSRGSNQALW